MRNIKITLEYEGTGYSGWQRQKNTRRTVQQITEDALEGILQEKVALTGAGRTDRGVHAKNQVANFKTSSKLKITNIKNALNSRLDDDIRVKRVEEENLDFHARYQAKKKIYRYIIDNSFPFDVFYRRFSWGIKPPLDIDIMKKQSAYLAGRRDFRAFAASGNTDKNTVRTIYRLDIKKKTRYIYIDVEADGFLHNMVRNIVGTLVDFSLGRNKMVSARKILFTKNRIYAGRCAPAKGLFLWKVLY